MADVASRDENRVPTLIGVSSTGYKSPVTVAADPNDHSILTQAKIYETSPVDGTKVNASYVVSYNSNGDCVQVEKTINGVTYTKNIVPQNADTVISTTESIGIWS